jgi:hypothetical protein
MLSVGFLINGSHPEDGVWCKNAVEYANSINNSVWHSRHKEREGERRKRERGERERGEGEERERKRERQGEGEDSV